MSKNAPTLMHVGAFLDLVSLAVHQNSMHQHERHQDDGVAKTHGIP